jgi:hypothetical protein
LIDSVPVCPADTLRSWSAATPPATRTSTHFNDGAIPATVTIAAALPVGALVADVVVSHPAARLTIPHISIAFSRGM